MLYPWTLAILLYNNKHKQTNINKQTKKKNPHKTKQKRKTKQKHPCSTIERKKNKLKKDIKWAEKFSYCHKLSNIQSQMKMKETWAWTTKTYKQAGKVKVNKRAVQPCFAERQHPYDTQTESFHLNSAVVIMCCWIPPTKTHFND